jgi:hypothetical protein
MFCANDTRNGMGRGRDAPVRLGGDYVTSKGAREGVAQAMGAPLEDGDRLTVQAHRDVRGQLIVRARTGDRLILARISDCR